MPAWQSLVLGLVAAVMLIAAFPDFDIRIMAWLAIIPLLMAVEREKASRGRAFIVGWVFGLVFFFGTCWWLTHAPITYAGFPPLLAYFLLFVVCSIVAFFSGIFAELMAVLLRRLNTAGVLAAPFVWTAAELLRYLVTGNNWNALGYSQAFTPFVLPFAAVGGVMMVSFLCAAFAAIVVFGYLNWPKRRIETGVGLLVFVLFVGLFGILTRADAEGTEAAADIVAIQPNVPMSGLSYEKWQELRERHVLLTERALAELRARTPTASERPTTVIFPESPMNFMYSEDPEFRWFITEFSRKHKVSVLFNSAEPNHADGKYFNSAKMVGPDGKPVGRYDKIHLVPFGEFVPGPFEYVIPAFVGSFSRGSDHRLLPLGETNAGVMICFESHFGELAREYVINGADVLVELTNDGYLGNTPVLRQHLANAVFRAAETNRPVLRVTNVGITAYINERGEIFDPAPTYQEDTRTWSVAISDGSQTFYVKHGDWFAWLSVLVTVGLLGVGLVRLRT